MARIGWLIAIKNVPSTNGGSTGRRWRPRTIRNCHSRAHYPEIREIGGGGIRQRPQGELSERERTDMTLKSPLFSVSRLRRDDKIGSNSD